MGYQTEPDQESIARPHKIFSSDRTGTCWTCDKMVNYGIDDATGNPIAWCAAKNHVVAPERGCEYYKHT